MCFPRTDPLYQRCQFMREELSQRSLIIRLMSAGSVLIPLPLVLILPSPLCHARSLSILLTFSRNQLFLSLTFPHFLK